MNTINARQAGYEKIDQDTKERFKDTFEKVDKKLQEILHH